MENLTKSFCGLFVKNTEASVPLTAIHYDVEIKAFAGRITIHQTYKNQDTNDLECVYGFPINDQASIVGFTVKIDDRTLTSQFKKKDEAFQEYNDAIFRGDGAYLLDQSDGSDDTFVLSVGRLPPQKECVIAISYICTLESITETKTRLVIPMSLSPRYNPTPTKSSGIAPPEKYQTIVPYSATFTGRIEAIDTIHSVTSPTHPLAMTILAPKLVSVQFGASQQPLDRDLIVEIEVKQNPQNHLEIEMTSSGEFSVMYALTPNFDSSSSNDSVKTELVFLVDCSGSMREENKIEDAKRAMQIFLRSIPEGCFFNFYRFGSTFQSLFLQSEVYSSDSFTKAKEYTEAISADLGGTEILAPLQKIFAESPRPGFSRQLFVLTDGEVTNTQAVIDLVRNNSQKTRLFSFGLGQSPSRSLVNGIAIAANGKSEFIKQGELLEDKIGRHLNRALQPAITDASISWLGVKNLQQTPSTLPAIYKGDRQLIFAFFEIDTNSHESPGILLRIGNSKTEIPLPDMSLVKIEDVGQSFISKLAARAWIKHLECSPNQILSEPSGSLQKRVSLKASLESQEKITEEQISTISLKYGVLSKFVSLVAIEARSDTDRAKASPNMRLTEIPIQKLQSSTRHQGFSGGVFAFGAPLMGPTQGMLRGTKGGAPRPARSIISTLGHRSVVAMNSQSATRTQISQNFDSDCHLESSDSVPENVFSRNLEEREALRIVRDYVDSQKKIPNSSSALMALLELQQWNGSWNFSDKLEELTEVSVLQIKAALSNQPILENTVLATLLVVSFVKERFPENSNIWQAIVNKATVFLMKETNAATISVAESTLRTLVKTK